MANAQVELQKTWVSLGWAAGIINTQQRDSILFQLNIKGISPPLGGEATAVEYSGYADMKSNGFVLGKASLKELEGVKAELVAVVKLAIQLTTQDFTVFDGLRTLKEQQQHVKNGTSQTMKSKHLDGLAVDLVPWVNGKAVWDWDKIYAIAFAMDEAATKLGFANKIRWGGAWDRVLSDFGGSPAAYKKECEAYAARHPGKDFLDGPHFEWVG